MGIIRLLLPEVEFMRQTDSPGVFPVLTRKLKSEMKRPCTGNVPGGPGDSPGDSHIGSLNST